jgi:tetratricopeptide (TPR) repeat protein
MQLEDAGFMLRKPVTRDVFIVFSKSETMEARFALAVKDGLERLGRFAYEYEDWSWVEQRVEGSDEETDVDRVRLRSMLQDALAVLVIPPRNGKPSEGVATELDLLAEMQLPVLILRWSYPHVQFDGDDLNVIYRYQIHGSAPNDRWIASAGQQLAELLWLACTVSELRNKYAPAGNLILDQLPAFGSEPVTSYKLRDGLIKEDDYLREPDPDAVGRSIDGSATADQLKALIEDWWLEAAPALGFLEIKGHGPVRRPCAALRQVMQGVVKRARDRFPELQHFSADALQRQGMELSRFGDFDNAIAVLTQALARTDRYHNRIYAARAYAHDDRGDLHLALADMDAAVECADNNYDEAVNRFTRAVYRAKLKTPDAFRAAIDDYSRILDLNPEPAVQLDALNYRAMQYRRLGEIDAALADWSAVINRHDERPRAAAQARLNRAGHLSNAGSLPEARDDLTKVLEWADVSSTQRFRALEARAKVYEGLGEFAAAADDIEELLALDMADPQWRPELKEKIQSLRKAAGKQSR